MSEIEINPQFEQVLGFVNRTNQLIFLTGKAGTGKTTLLKYIKEKTFKQIAIVAPTGVAAINAGGSTIHSFFQFPFSPFLPALKESGEIDYAKNNLPTLKYNTQRLAIFRNLELLVIDEISMVRADLLDQIDATLRFTRKKSSLPFGGVQVLLIGDMYQLPPVVQHEEWSLLRKVYPSQYFFDSVVIRQHRPVYIELDKIYRQSEQIFVDLLNKVRNNILDEQSLDLLNSHFKADLKQKDYQENITLTTHNKKADEINSRNMDALPGRAYKFRSKVEGSFSEKNFPADEVLILKVGAKVMFLKNNSEKNYYNGKIGTVTFLNDDKIKVKCEEDKYETEVSKESWTNVSYKVDKSTKHIEEEVLGTYSQYPLRLAWAITIHKSQGLTFDKLIIDAAESFSAGQVYVALSRCRSLSGLTLSSKINKQSLLNDNNILKFASTRQDNEQVNTIFSNAQKEYVKTVLLGLFDLTEQVHNRSDLAGALQLHKTRINNDGAVWAQELMSMIDALNNISIKFKNQLSGLFTNVVYVESDDALQTRLKQAAVYFETEFKKVVDHLRNCSLITENKEAATELNDILQYLFETFYAKQTLVRSISKGFIFSDFIKHKLKLVYPDFKISVYATAKNTKVSSDIKYPQLYKQLMLKRDEICNDEHAPNYMVANNKALSEMANFLPSNAEELLQISGFGEARVNAYGPQFLPIIKAYMSENNLNSAMDVLSGKSKKAKKPKKEKGEGEGAAAKVSTKEQTYLLYKQGKSLEEIARQRGYTLGTIQGHLIPYIETGEVDLNELVSEHKQKIISKALEKFDPEVGINPIKNELPADVSYAEIKYMLALRHNDESNH